MSNEQINEDLYNPLFQGDDISTNNALQYWASIFGIFSSLELSVQDDVNKLSILNSLSSLINVKISELINPAQTSMASVTAGVPPSPNKSEPAMTTLNFSQPSESNNAANLELENNKMCQNSQMKPDINNSITTKIDNVEKTEDDLNKKMMVDLTIESKDQIDSGGHILSFKEWFGIQSSEIANHVKIINDENIVRIANFNEACLRGNALIQKNIAKGEVLRRGLSTVGKKNLSESSKRTLEIAGINIKS